MRQDLSEHPFLLSETMLRNNDRTREMVNSKMEKKKETSSNRKENKDNNEAGILTKLDNNPCFFKI